MHDNNNVGNETKEIGDAVQYDAIRTGNKRAHVSCTCCVTVGRTRIVFLFSFFYVIVVNDLLTDSDLTIERRSSLDI